jgi:hypothetical protein
LKKNKKRRQSWGENKKQKEKKPKEKTCGESYSEAIVFSPRILEYYLMLSITCTSYSIFATCEP